MCFDTDVLDKEVEEEAFVLIEQINKILLEAVPDSLPQLHLEEPKPKIGITIYKSKKRK
jgi:hypothetical protein